MNMLFWAPFTLCHILCLTQALPMAPDGSDWSELCQGKYFGTSICQRLIKTGQLGENVICDLFCGTGIILEECDCDGDRNVTSTTPVTTTVGLNIINATTVEMPAYNVSTTTLVQNTTAPMDDTTSTTPQQSTLSTITTTQSSTITTTQSSTTTTSICEELCKAGMGGAVCQCEGQPPAKQEDEEDPLADSSYEDLCHEFCRDGLGGSLCQCEGLAPAMLVERANRPVKAEICQNLCQSGYDGPLCPCNVRAEKRPHDQRDSGPREIRLPVGPPV